MKQHEKTFKKARDVYKKIDNGENQESIYGQILQMRHDYEKAYTLLIQELKRIEEYMNRYKKAYNYVFDKWWEEIEKVIDKQKQIQNLKARIDRNERKGA